MTKRSDFYKEVMRTPEKCFKKLMRHAQGLFLNAHASRPSSCNRFKNTNFHHRVDIIVSTCRFLDKFVVNKSVSAFF